MGGLVCSFACRPLVQRSENLLCLSGESLLYAREGKEQSKSLSLCIQVCLRVHSSKVAIEKDFSALFYLHITEICTALLSNLKMPIEQITVF